MLALRVLVCGPLCELLARLTPFRPSVPRILARPYCTYFREPVNAAGRLNV